MPTGCQGTLVAFSAARPSTRAPLAYRRLRTPSSLPTLVHAIQTCSCAVIVNDMAELNIDAGLVKRGGLIQVWTVSLSQPARTAMTGQDRQDKQASNAFLFSLHLRCFLSASSSRPAGACMWAGMATSAQPAVRTWRQDVSVQVSCQRPR